ncbi:hypothetical protein CDL15_Pgr015018 [Punica granatum]|nr:hypothetical protein CDL15_Pgr015018 [Punica granatum]
MAFTGEEQSQVVATGRPMAARHSGLNWVFSSGFGWPLEASCCGLLIGSCADGCWVVIGCLNGPGGCEPLLSNLWLLVYVRR